MKLLGAKKFINMPKGTFFISYTCSSIEQLNKLILNMQSSPESYINLDFLRIYGNCEQSIYLCTKENSYNITSTNIGTDLAIYLIIDDYLIPSKLKKDNLAASEIFKLKDNFIMSFPSIDNIHDRTNEKTKSILNSENKILNDIYNLELEISF